MFDRTSKDEARTTFGQLSANGVDDTPIPLNRGRKSCKNAPWHIEIKRGTAFSWRQYNVRVGLDSAMSNFCEDASLAQISDWIIRPSRPHKILVKESRELNVLRAK